MSISQTAERFRQIIETALDEADRRGQPVHILAHSMGGLVVRAMLATPEGGQLWQRMIAHPGGRFVILGTPNGGSHAIAAMLMGRDALCANSLSWISRMTTPSCCKPSFVLMVLCGCCCTRGG